MEKKRTRAEELAWTRERILKTAQNLFMEKGYRAVSTREIASECGITQPALYYHFSDKESLYVAMLQGFVAKIGKRLKSVSKPTVAERLETMLEVLSEEHPSSMMMMLHDTLVEFKEENRRFIFKLWKEAYLDSFVTVFEEMKNEGILREQISPEEAARFCLLTLGQTMSTWEGKPKSLAGQFKTLVDLILHGTKKTES
ncbi:TetR/AcrR family transcriptional regulator [Priestia endophytica]|uniref:TetR/AcrR family transcriptional regulator n=1 Tax=Priestia endophytica TaxID=135735 RepID=UPI000DCA491D|nr:TetR/AcrR family transcriptional regulator [Priestia endophytica]RAS74167.1 TetR family transcriptional regulator [Priestia endophytica]